MIPENGAPTDLLIVENQAFMRVLLREFVQAEFPACSIAEAASGRRALELVRELHPRLVLMDVSLPDANGIDLIEQVKGLRRETRVVIVTQMSGSAYRERARDGGAFGYVTKERIYTDLPPLVAGALGIRRDRGASA